MKSKRRQEQRKQSRRNKLKFAAEHGGKSKYQLKQTVVETNAIMRLKCPNCSHVIERMSDTPNYFRFDCPECENNYRVDQFINLTFS